MFKQVLKLKKRRTAVLWLLVIVLVLPMILFFQGGFRSMSQPGPGGTAGVLFGREVPWETFEQERQALRRSIAAQFGDMPEALEPLVRQQAWDRLMLEAEARRRIRVTDHEVARALQDHPTFQQDGRFVPELYFNFVRGLGLTPQLFEERVRNDLQVQRLLERVRGEVTVTDEELRRAWAESHDPVEEAEFGREQEAFRVAVLAHRQQEHLAAWIEGVRARAKLKSYVEPPPESGVSR